MSFPSLLLYYNRILVIKWDLASSTDMISTMRKKSSIYILLNREVPTVVYSYQPLPTLIDKEITYTIRLKRYTYQWNIQMD